MLPTSHSNAAVIRSANHTQNTQVKKSQSAPTPKKLLGLAVGLFAVAGLGLAAYTNRSQSQLPSQNGMCLLSEGSVSKTSYETCLLSEQPTKTFSTSLISLSHQVEETNDEKFIDLKRIVEIKDLESKFMSHAWLGVGSSSWTNICNPWKDFCEVRKVYQDEDAKSGKKLEARLNEIGYSEMLEKVKNLGLTLTEKGVSHKDGIDLELAKEADELAAKQIEGMKIGRAACEERRVNKQKARDVTSGCGNLFAKGGDFYRSGETAGFSCDYYAKKTGYNALKLVQGSQKTNKQVNAITEWFCSKF